MNEATGVELFSEWLESRGWNVQLEVEHLDVLATKGDLTLRVEAKGHTKYPGIDVDTAFGQILRRMNSDPGVRYALVVPATIRSAVERVASDVRSLLRLGIYLVGEDGTVVDMDGPESTPPTEQDLNDDWIKTRSWDLPLELDEAIVDVAWGGMTPRDGARQLASLPAGQAMPVQMRQELWARFGIEIPLLTGRGAK